MYCEKCGSFISDDSKFCSNCGSSVTVKNTNKLDSEEWDNKVQTDVLVKKNEYTYENEEALNNENFEKVLNKWNWGAFTFNCIWGIFNKSYKAFLTLIPIFGVFYIFVCGSKGSRWAWENRSWKSKDEYIKSVESWNKWGFIVFVISMIILLGSISFTTYLFGNEDVSSKHNDINITKESEKNVTDEIDITIENNEEDKISIKDIFQSPQVKSIRSLQTEEGILFGDLFDAGLAFPEYELYDPAEDGNTYVTISGEVEYMDKTVVATIQYKQISDDEYEYYTLALNDIPMNEFEANGFFEYLYNSYYELHPEAMKNVSAIDTMLKSIPSDWQIRNDDIQGQYTVLSKNGITVSIIERGEAYTVDDILYYDDINLSYFEYVELNSTSNPIGTFPYSYSYIDLGGTEDAFYLCVGSDGTFSTKLFVPTNKCIIEIEIFENGWDENYSFDYVDKVYSAVLNIASSVH